jgi:hypothetical protein
VLEVALATGGFRLPRPLPCPRWRRGAQLHATARPRLPGTTIAGGTMSRRAVFLPSSPPLPAS